MGRELQARREASFLLAPTMDERLQAGPALCMLIWLGIVLSVVCWPGGIFFFSFSDLKENSLP